MWTLPGPLSEKLNFKFVINSKADFSGDQKHKKLHFDTKCHIFGSTWESNNFKTCFWIIIKFSEITASQIYFRLKDISGCENFVSKIRGFIKLKKKSCGMFFQCLILNISSIKELLHKPSEIQWNITGTLPGKLKRKNSWALSYKILPPEISESSCNTWFTDTQHLTSIAGQWRYTDGSIGCKNFTRTSFSSTETSSLTPSYHSFSYK